MEKNRVSPSMADPNFEPPPYPAGPGPQGQPLPIGYIDGGQPQPPQLIHFGPPQPPAQPVVQYVNPAPALGPMSTRMTCPHCRADISTQVKHNPSCMTHMAAGILCLVGCWCCVCIPYCSDSCMDAEHECPSCQKFIGNYRR